MSNAMPRSMLSSPQAADVRSLVMLALARVIADSTCRRLQNVYYLTLMLPEVARARPYYAGRTQPPIPVEVDQPGGNTAAGALAHVTGWNVERVRSHFHDDDEYRGIEAGLPDTVLLALLRGAERIDIATWVAMEAPELGMRRAEVAVADYAKVRRPSQAELVQRLRIMRRLARMFRRLAREHPEGQVLTPWRDFDRPARMPRGRPATVNKQGVPSAVIQEALARPLADICRRLRCRPGGELAAAQAMSREQVADCCLFSVLRNLTLLVVEVQTCGRVGALSERLTVGDVYLRRVMLDGVVRPALAFRPGKCEHPDEEEVHGLGPWAGYLVDLWLHVMAVLLGPRDRLAPLFPASLEHPERPLSYRAWSRQVRGAQASPKGRAKVSIVTFELEGVQTHALRRSGMQHVRSAVGKAFLAEHYPDYEAHVVAEAMAGHSIRSDLYGYFGYDTRAGLELLTAVGAELLEHLYCPDATVGTAEHVAAPTGAATQGDPLRRATTRGDPLRELLNHCHTEHARLRELLYASSGAVADALTTAGVGDPRSALADYRRLAAERDALALRLDALTAERERLAALVGTPGENR